MTARARCRTCDKPLREVTVTDYQAVTLERLEHRDRLVALGERSYVERDRELKAIRRKHTRGTGHYGYRGEGLFCSLGCGYRYGLKAARADAVAAFERRLEEWVDEVTT